MNKKIPDFRLEICDLKIKDDKTKIYLKGWVHANEYKIIVRNKNSKNILFEFIGTESKYDVCLYFDEPIVDNKYGFDSKETVDGNLKEIDIYMLYKNKEYIVFKVRNNKIHNAIQKIKKVLTMFKKAIKLFWKEYHFLVPPTMLQKYINDFKNRMVTIKNENSKCYNQDIVEEYNQWINRYEFQGNRKTKLDNISYVIFGSNEVQSLGNSPKYNLNNNIEEIVSQINTEYVCFLEDTCIIHKNFNYYVKSILNNDPDFIYGDHDYFIDGERQNPYFKPDWSPDTIYGANYIGQLFIVKTDLIKKTLLNSDIENIYNYILKLTSVSKKIYHISNILYHCQLSKINQDDNYKIVRNNIKEAIIIKNNDKETLTVEYKIKKEPLISIIIPTKDAPETLEKCLKSIYEKSTYKKYEIIIIDNNSCADATFKLFDKYKNKYDNFIVKRLDCEFNYSYLNNEAVKISKGEYIVLLNNDTEVITPNWLELMLGYALQKHIGTVGVKLLFEDNTIQHAGLIIGKGGLAGHAHYGEERYAISNQWELKIPYNVSGNTAACIMISKEKYLEVNGLEEKLQVAFNDVDFNLKVREKGYYNIYLPNVELYHYESKTRGLDTTPEKQKRFMTEWQFMKNKWNRQLEYDPYYNENFSKEVDYKLDASKEGFKSE